MPDDESDEIDDEEDEDCITLDKELVFVVKLHETLVSGFEVTPVSIRMLRDPDLGFSDAEYLLDYDLGYGETLEVACKREGGNMLISLTSGGKESNYSVPLDRFVDDDFMPVVDEEYSMLVQDWFE